MTKIINFKSRSKTEFEVQPKPYPAVKNLPSWFLNASPYEMFDGMQSKTIRIRDKSPNTTYKKCTPLLDGMSAGYIIPLWADVQVEYENGDPSIFWKTVNHVFSTHGFGTRNIETPPGYHPQVFKYNNCWIPQTPKGYSCLITSPFGHNDLPFKAVPAIVDTDRSTLELVFPMWVKNDLNAVVEKGTPMIQVIPFKRDNWESTFDYYEDGEYRNIIEEKNFSSTIVGHYLKNVWSKKSFK